MARGWIQKAVRRKGSLKRWMNTEKAKKLARGLHVSRFTRDGEINQRFLYRVRKSNAWNSLSTATKRRINLAITLERLKKR